MTRKTSGALLAAWCVLANAPSSRAQDDVEAAKVDKSPRDMAQATRKLLEELAELQKVDKPDAGQQQQLEAARAALTKVVDAFKNPAAGMTVEHYVEVSSVLLEQRRHSECIAVSEAGLSRFPESRFLLDHVGFAQTMIAVGLKPGSKRLAALEAAAAAFHKALPLKPDTFHTHLGLSQALDLLDRPGEALKELEACTRDPEGKKAVERVWQRRAAFLLRAGKHKEALAELQAASSGLPPEDKAAASILTLRAIVLAGDVKKAQEQITALLAADDSPQATSAAADALIWLGKRDDAIKLLDKRPVKATGKGDGKDDEDPDAVRQQIHETMKVMAKTTDWSPAGPLRMALVKSLEHRFLSTTAGTDGKPATVDFSGSPVLMAYLVQSIPHDSPKDWGNFILLGLCLRSIDGYKALEGETMIQSAVDKTARLPRPNDLPAVLIELRRQVGEPDAAGGLCALRAAEKLADKKPAGKR